MMPLIVILAAGEGKRLIFNGFFGAFLKPLILIIYDNI